MSLTYVINFLLISFLQLSLVFHLLSVFGFLAIIAFSLVFIVFSSFKEKFAFCYF